MRKLKMNSVDLNKIVKEELKSYLNEIDAVDPGSYVGGARRPAGDKDEPEAEEEEGMDVAGEEKAREMWWLPPKKGGIKWKHLLAAWKMTSRGIAGGKSSMDYYNENAVGKGEVAARAHSLHQSMKGGFTGIGTNESQLLGNIANDPATNQAIKALYDEDYGNLVRHIKNELADAAASGAGAGALAGATMLNPGSVAAGTAIGAGLGKLFGKNLQTIAIGLLASYKIDEWDPATGTLNVNKILGREEEEPEEEEKDDKENGGGGVAMAVLTGGVIVDRTTGDKFRAWVNKTHPDYARQIDLDPSGPYNNSYIRKAWAQYGEEYKASLKGDPTPKPEPKPEPKVEPKQDKVEKEKKEAVPTPTFTGSKAMQEYDRAIAELQGIEKKYRAMAKDPKRKAIPEKARNLPPIMKRYISLKTDYLPIDIARIADKKITEFERKKARLTRQETRPSADRKAGQRADKARKQRFRRATPQATAPRRGQVAQAYAADKGIKEGAATMKVTKDLIESMVREETIEVMKTHRKKINLNEEYTVKPGDSVSKIAQRLGITTQDMIMANPELEKNPDLIRVGQKLVLPVKTYGDIGTVADRPSPKPPASVAQRTGQGVKLDRDDYVRATTPRGHVAMTSDVPVPRTKKATDQSGDPELRFATRAAQTQTADKSDRGWRAAIAKAKTPAEVRKATDRILAQAEERYGVGNPQLKTVAKQVRVARADKLSQLASGAGREKAAGRLAKRAGRIGGGDTGVA